MPWDRPPGRRASESRRGPAPWEVCAPQLPGPRILDKHPVGQSISVVATQVAGPMLAVILMRQGQRTLLTGRPGFWPPGQLHPGHSKHWCPRLHWGHHSCRVQLTQATSRMLPRHSGARDTRHSGSFTEIAAFPALGPAAKPWLLVGLSATPGPMLS